MIDADYELALDTVADRFIKQVPAENMDAIVELGLGLPSGAPRATFYAKAVEAVAIARNIRLARKAGHVFKNKILDTTTLLDEEEPENASDGKLADYLRQLFENSLHRIGPTRDDTNRTEG